MYQRYKDRAAFFIIYIEEAHTSDIWQMAANERDNVIFNSPRDSSERTSLAQACVRNLKIDFPALVDSFDNATERAYTAWPDRLYVVDRFGRIAHKSQAGPFGFKPKPMEEALKSLL